MGPSIPDLLGRTLERERRLDAIRAHRNKQCRRCPLYKAAQSVCTLGDGNPASTLALIGEAPGRREDDLEKPFQGQAGQWLDETLGKVGIRRDQVYIDNVVRCRPPGNRAPEDSEIKACRYYLKRILRVVAPRVVVALGATALAGLTGRSGITKLRGRKLWSSRFGFIVVPTFHPAYVLRNRSGAALVRRDLRMAVDMLGLFGLEDK